MPNQIRFHLVQSCSTAAKSIMKDLVGNYVPQCTSEGFYKPIQCHGGSGMCWCVDKNGVEFINTRRRGKPDCGEYFLFFFLIKKL